MPKEIYRCDLCRREGEAEDYPCYSFEYPQGKCLHGCTDEPEWEPMCTEAKLDKAVQAEREACAMECIELKSGYQIRKRPEILSTTIAGIISGCQKCAEAIHKRGE